MKKIEEKRPKDEYGKPHGYWEQYWSNGNLFYKVYYIHGKRYGYFEQYYTLIDQLMYKGSYIHGDRHGYWEKYYSDGQLCYKGYYHNGEELYQTSKDKIIL